MALMSAPILGYPDMTNNFHNPDTDAMLIRSGAVLSTHEGKEVVVAYYSNPSVKRNIFNTVPRKAKQNETIQCGCSNGKRVALDITGTPPISYKNNKYALIVTDYFTKWVEGFPMPDMETTTIVDNLVNHFFCRFGIPCQMHSDQGRQFESGLFKELCAKLKIDKTRTTSFRPQSNGLVERYNRTLENTISKYISKNQRDWDEQLPWALMAYNSSEHETTKFSPSMLMLGRELQLPVDLIYGPHPQEIEYPDETVSHNDYVKNRLWKSPEKKLVCVPEKSTPRTIHKYYYLRDSRHLACQLLGMKSVLKTDFRLHPPRFQCSCHEASKCILVMKKARRQGIYRQCIAVGYGCKKEGKICILPDGTV
ncbi:unnamed protein product [Mytilus edulis]|uniref:Integrase catalytic domain-containing protein n=1 Tax=Mytilus edulis TaxID=6550 RepID=A0A8S3TQH3_MYTED|nr:unnamed protein product [Mytilus edulis]